MRAMDQVERRAAVPTGMDAWSSEDQEAVHERLAATVMDPVTNLESRVAQLVSVFADAEVGVKRLTALKFPTYGYHLAPIVETVSGLESLSRRLLKKVMVALDNLRDRIDVCVDYRIPYELLSNTIRQIDQASSIVISMRKSLNGL